MAPTSSLRQPIEREGGHVRLSDPGRLEFRPERHDQQHAKGPNPVHDPTEHFQARGVGPMRILEDHQHRTLACQGLHLRNERFQRSLPALLRGQIERGIASIVRQATASRQRARRPAIEVEVCASNASSLSSFACGVSSCASPAARSIWPMIG